jgi:hypothetical protein
LGGAVIAPPAGPRLCIFVVGEQARSIGPEDSNPFGASGAGAQPECVHRRGIEDGRCEMAITAAGRAIGYR